MNKNVKEVDYTRKGELSISIQEINDNLGHMSKLLNEIEDLVFAPRPCEPECEGMPIPMVKTVNGELRSINIKVLSGKERVALILDALSRNLDTGLRLID